MTLIDQGYAEVRRQWEGGKLTEETFYDAKGEPTVRTDGAARVVYQYSEDGKPAGEIRYDAEGAELPAAE